jgi:tRNA1(Val) A37 N6-methylase TrmN6
MGEAPAGLSPESPPEGLSSDAWLGGRLQLVQPRVGHRVGSDAALLAAAADLSAGRVVDVGAGVGAVGLALLRRRERVTADLVEIDPNLVRLAADNAARNGLVERARVLSLDICDARARREAGLVDDAAEAVLTNPPFFDPTRVRASPDQEKRRAHVLSADAPGIAPLAGWIRASIAILKPGGRFTMIHRPDALSAILAATENRLGALALLPVHPRAGALAHRLLVTGVKGSRAPLRIAPTLILHGGDGRLTPEADAIHRGEALVDWGV